MTASQRRPSRLPGEMEVGLGDVFLPTQAPHPVPRRAPPSWIEGWEMRRPQWLVECVAEFTGVLVMCWAGMGATATFYTTSEAGQMNMGSMLSVAFAWSFGLLGRVICAPFVQDVTAASRSVAVPHCQQWSFAHLRAYPRVALAVVLVGPTSGAHLSPGVTIALAIFKGFQWRKVPYYILSQISGAFVAGCLIYAQFRPALRQITETMVAAGQGDAIFTPAGPAGTIGLFISPGANLGTVLINEFACTIIIAIGIFSVLDPSNHFVAPASAAFVISILFFISLLCFTVNGVALNTARDLGSRLAVACFWGRGAFVDRYAALSALTNILGMSCGGLFHTLFLSDTILKPKPKSLSAQREHIKRALEARLANGSSTSTKNDELMHIEDKDIV